VNELARSSEPIEGVDERSEEHRAEEVPIHLVGVEFSREQRTLTRLEVQTITS